MCHALRPPEPEEEIDRIERVSRDLLAAPPGHDAVQVLVELGEAALLGEDPCLTDVRVRLHVLRVCGGEDEEERRESDEHADGAMHGGSSGGAGSYWAAGGKSMPWCPPSCGAAALSRAPGRARSAVLRDPGCSRADTC